MGPRLSLEKSLEHLFWKSTSKWKMKGICVTRDSSGNAVFVTVSDGCGNTCPYSISDYEAKGYKPDWRTLPDKADMK